MNEPLAVLARIRQTKPRVLPRAGEKCEMCAVEITDEHGHCVDVESRQLMCVCRGCYLLFAPDGAGGGHFKAVPDRYLAFPEFRLSPAQWDALQIPVSVAFFFANSAMQRIAGFYPSPAGATESLLELETWDEIVEANPGLATLEPDVEAFLVRTDKRGGRGSECYLVPIDACYELVGELRRLWRGFDGGKEANDALESFFANVRLQATAGNR
ncbi:MAG: DUF5947 family protein [Acidimicrobiia bacterium]